MGELAEDKIWARLFQMMQALDDVRKLIDGPISKINKIHSKVVNKAAESKRKKRKIEDKAKSSKRSRTWVVSDQLRTNLVREELPELFAPLVPGSQVAVRPVEQDYMLAVVVRWLPDKLKYEVEDAEDDEENPGTRKRFLFPPKLVIPIPEVPHKPEFPINHVVLALYPNSSCFYKANVVKPPSKNQDEEAPGFYVVRFDDDNGFERFVDPIFVLNMPKGGTKVAKS
ncbi:hypothetical protein HDU67_009316 [Dinochytrium kinnereticum]|nr:hypothetical protein HDU67_009316 [Dinochytrium kinnereticum]